MYNCNYHYVMPIRIQCILVSKERETLFACTIWNPSSKTSHLSFLSLHLWFKLRSVQRTKWACAGQISCFHLNEQLNVSTFFVVPRIMGNIIRAIKLSKYNMLIKESFTLPNMRGDRDEIYLWYAAISEFKFELITQHHIWQELKQTLITHFEDLKGFF